MKQEIKIKDKHKMVKVGIPCWDCGHYNKSIRDFCSKCNNYV